MTAAAPTSEIDICNLSLGKLRQPGIGSIDDPQTPAENQCAMFYHQTRRMLLASYDWTFAMDRISVAADGAAPAFQYTKQFTIPNTVLRVCSRHESDGTLIHPDDRAVEGNKVLVSVDSGPIYLRVVLDHTTVSAWSPLFVELMVLKLAASIASALAPNATNQVKTLEVLADSAMKLAQAESSRANPITRITKSSLIDARNIGGTMTRYV